MPRWPRTRTEPELVQFVSLTAASSRVTQNDSRAERNAGLYGWQLRALGFGETLGEIWYASKFYERALRNLKLIVQTREADGSWKISDDSILNGALSGLVDANGEQSALLGMYGRQMFLTGEARLYGEVDPDTGLDVWEMLSVEEIHVNDQGDYVRQRSPIDPREVIAAAPPTVFRPTGDGAVMFRLWNPSPRFSAVADAPMKAVLDICDELLLLTRSLRGEIKSRLSNNGIMFLPAELMLPTLQQGVRPDEDPGADGFMRRLEAALETGITDESSPASQIPIIVRGPGDLFTKIVHLRFDKPMGDEQAKRDECVKRLAMSLDMPPEALTGIADTNHWGAWQIDESSWKVHIQPVAQTLVENLTSSWFRPLMGDLGDTVEVRIWYDESEVVNHPDRTADFKDGFDRYVVSTEAYAKAMGLQSDEVMSPEEQDRQAELRALAHRGSAATTTPPAGTDAATATPPGGAGPTAAAPGATPGGTSGPPATKPATTPPAGSPATTPPVSAPKAARALAAAESAVWRCREVAGSRLRSKIERGEFKEVANVDLARAVFREHGTHMDIAADALVAGGGALFARQLMGYGFDRSLAEQVVTAAEAHARDTLFDSEPGELPDEVVAMCALGALSGAPT